MKLIWFIALVPLAAGVIAATCDGDGEPSPATGNYFQLVEQFLNNATPLTANLEQQLDERLPAAQSDEERVLVVGEFLTPSGSLFQNLAAQLEMMQPPEKATEAHDELVAAAGELSELFAGLSDRLATIDAVDNLDELEGLTGEIGGPEFAAAEERFGDACSQLQDAADASDAAVELACAG